jgi:hypothetical protein
MGTSLTGLTPSTTYDALIKVGDNGALSATAKVLSDGLGNDSVLALSTTAVGIGTTAPIGLLHLYKAAATTRMVMDGDAGQSKIITYRTAGLQRFGLYVNNTAESGANAGSDFAVRAYSDAGTLLSTPLFIKRSTGNVGIGTTAPLSILNVQQAVNTELSLLYTTNTGANFTQITGGSALENFGKWASIKFAQNASNDAHHLIFSTASPSVDTTERGRFTSDGYLRLSATSGGIQFNGDTAAANALDDYEEGTWTMGVTFGGGSTAITYVNNTGTYTKIGRQVTVNGLIQLSNKGTDTGIAKITGLPFTIPNNTANYSTATLWFFNIDFANQFQSVADINTTNISLFESTEGGAITSLNDTDFANNSEIILSLTYFV